MTPRNQGHGFRSLFVAVMSCSALLLSGAGDGPHVASVSGAVEIATGAPPVWRVVAAGDAIEPGDAVRTGHDGRAELVLGTGTVRLYPNSMLRIPMLGGGPGASEKVRLERGRSLFDVLKRRNGRFEVETPEVVVSVKGTRFGVDLNESLAQVAVFRGLVGVREASQTLAMETLVREGFAAVGGASRPFELMLNGASDPWDGFSAGRVEAMIENRATLRGVAPNAAAPGSAAGMKTAAIAEARTAAQRVAEPDVVQIALDRDPALRKRVKQLTRAGLEANPTPAKLAPNALESTVVALEVADPNVARDTVADTRAVQREIEKELVEKIVTGFDLPETPGGGSTGGGGAGAPGANFSLENVGPGMVHVIADGQTFPFTALDITLLAAGFGQLPVPLETFFLEENVDVNLIIQQMGLLVQ